MRKLLAFLVLLVGCGSAALPDNAIDAGPCGATSERCCSAEEAKLPCAAMLGCERIMTGTLVSESCEACDTIGPDGRCVE